MDQLYDGSSTVVAVCAFFIPTCIIVTSLRIWVRWTSGTQGLDDHLLLSGLILWIVSTAMCFPAAWNGVGAHVERYTTGESVKALKYFFLFQDFYVWANIPIKSAICLTMNRLAGDIRWIKWTLYFMIFVTVSSSLGTNIYLLTDCKPLSATWDKSGEYTCRAASQTVTLGNAYSAINIVVDWTVALLPVFLLWKVKLAMKQKMVVMGILALGIFASTATLIRLNKLTAFADPDDYLYGLGPIVIWTVTELALALIAASLVSLRPLVRRWFGSTQQKSSETSGINNNSSNPFRSTRSRQPHPFQRTESQDSNIGLEDMIGREHLSPHAAHEVNASSQRRDEDNDSQSSIIHKGGNKDIMVTRTLRME